ncbi:Uncharacterized protein dnm_080090 [Desulfonema magnum]|uniref:Uncharacterized protein n=1 Tax=Desulfonema magnum TaxID=45655 RepID=A0A975BUD9_9BACT|nr:Uncharacterized protein dnm_080090 [Desulfonema magnum]
MQAHPAINAGWTAKQILPAKNGKPGFFLRGSNHHPGKKPGFFSGQISENLWSGIYKDTHPGIITKV